MNSILNRLGFGVRSLYIRKNEDLNIQRVSNVVLMACYHVCGRGSTFVL
jgi:hypothetical protein